MVSTARLKRTYPNQPGPTARELEVLAAVGRGHTAKTAAIELGLSEHTINQHLKVVRYKLDARTTLHAWVLAHERGLL